MDEVINQDPINVEPVLESQTTNLVPPSEQIIIEEPLIVKKPNRKKIRIFLVILVIILSLVGFNFLKKIWTKWYLERTTTTTVLLKNVSSYGRIDDFYGNTDTKHFAIRVFRDEDRTSLVLFNNGNITKKQLPETAGSITFSPDYTQYAFNAQSQTGYNRDIVYNDTILGSYYEVNEILFSPNSSKLAYTINNFDNYEVFYGNQKNGVYGFIGGLVFSPDSQHVFYVAKINNRYSVFKDNDIIGEFDHIGSFNWYKKRNFYLYLDSQYLIFIAKQNNNWNLIKYRLIDGQNEIIPITQNQENISRLILDSDYNVTAYKIINPNNSKRWDLAVVLKGEIKEGTYTTEEIDCSLDGKHCAYTADEKLYYDGKEVILPNRYKFYKKYGFSFSPNSKHFAYQLERDEGGGFVPRLLINRVSLDGKVGKGYTNIWDLSFKKDSKLVYVANDNQNVGYGNFYLVLNNNQDFVYKYLKLIKDKDGFVVGYVYQENDTLYYKEWK